MIVDSSAVMAILGGEPEGDDMIRAILADPRPRMAAPTYVECAIVADRRAAPATRARFDRIMAELGIEVVPFGADQATVAREAYRRFGRGSGHPAGLNLGDCFAYALAALTGEPLLFKGDDFVHTDLVAVLPRVP